MERLRNDLFQARSYHQPSQRSSPFPAIRPYSHHSFTVHTPLKPHVCDVGPCITFICAHRSYRILRSVKRPSSDRKTSRSTRKSILKNITLCINTPRLSPFPARFTPGIVLNRKMMAPDFLLVQGLSMVTSQTVIVSSGMSVLHRLRDLSWPFRWRITYSFSGSDAPAGKSIIVLPLSSGRSYPFRFQDATSRFGDCPS